MAAAIQKATNVFITPDGFMGRFMDIVINQVFPYVILGALFGTSAGGTSLIKLAVRLTRKLRGGPAHAAIVSSAMFGTITGGPVTNVLSTGRLTIPMMQRTGFNKYFAGGVEAAASSGGQIMPPGHHRRLPPGHGVLLFDLSCRDVPSPPGPCAADERHSRGSGDATA